jgi:hypothetical protein
MESEPITVFIESDSNESDLRKALIALGIGETDIHNSTTPPSIYNIRISVKNGETKVFYGEDKCVSFSGLRLGEQAQHLMGIIKEVGKNRGIFRTLVARQAVSIPEYNQTLGH